MSDNFTQNRQIMSEALDLKNRLGPAQISRWQEEGYVFVNGLIEPLAIDAMSDAARNTIRNQVLMKPPRLQISAAQAR